MSSGGEYSDGYTYSDDGTVSAEEGVTLNDFLVEQVQKAKDSVRNARDNASALTLPDPIMVLLKNVRREQNKESEPLNKPWRGTAGKDRPVQVGDVYTNTVSAQAVDAEEIDEVPDYTLVFLDHDNAKNADKVQAAKWHLHKDAATVELAGWGDRAFKDADLSLQDEQQLYDVNRRRVVAALRQVGLIVKQVPSSDGDQIHVYVWAPEVLLRKHATRTNLRVQTRKGYDYRALESKTIVEASDADNESNVPRGTAVLDGSENRGEATNRLLYAEDYEAKYHFKFEPFSKSQRSKMIYELMTRPRDEGGAALRIPAMLRRGQLVAATPVHNPVMKKDLFQTWVKYFGVQPLNKIRDYFGEKIGMYFAFLGYYTFFLLVPAVLGIGWFVYGIIIGSQSTNVTPFFSLILVIWIPVFLEFWKRYNNFLNFNWSMTDFKEEERSRPDFQGKEVYGFYAKAGFVRLDPAVYAKMGIAPKYLPHELFFSGFTIKLRTALMMLLTVGIAAAVVIIHILLLWARAELSSRLDGDEDALVKWGTILGSLIVGITIAIINMVWFQVAGLLTKFCNHRTASSFEYFFIVKVFVVQSLNSYFSLFYVSYLKRTQLMEGFFGVDDTCAANPGDEGTSCLDELATLLASILITGQLTGQILEVIIPYLKFRATRALEERNIKDGTRRAPVEKQLDLPPFDGTLGEYSELILQFGYITMFAEAFPIGVTLAFINNVIEMHSDANKVLNQTRLPQYEAANGIGPFQLIMQVIGVIAIINNAFLTTFASDQIESLVGATESFDFATKVTIVLVIEHSLIIIWFLVAQLIPDKTYDVALAMDRESKRSDYRLKGAAGALRLSQWRLSLNDVDRKEHRKWKPRIKHRRTAKAEDNGNDNDTAASYSVQA